jgi:hypothetical protein
VTRRWIEGLLEFDVQRARAKAAAVHRAQHLNITDRVQTEGLGNAVPYEPDNLVDPLLGLRCIDEVEVRQYFVVGEFGHLATVDAMGVGDHPAAGRLAEHFGQADNRNQVGCDDVSQHLAGPDGGELVDIADDQQRCRVGHGAQQRTHQQNINHARLVHDQEIALEGMLLGPAEFAGPWISLQQTMNGLRLQPGTLRQPLGRPTRGRAKRHANLLGDQDLQD